MHSKWTELLLDEFPEVGDELKALDEHFSRKEKQLIKLIRFCLSRPELPLLKMCIEYSAAFDEVASEKPFHGTRVPPTAASDKRTIVGWQKWHQTHETLLDAVERLILSGEKWTLDTLFKEAKVDRVTIFNHFGTKNRLIVIMYDRLLS